MGLIKDILDKWIDRVENRAPNPKNPNHINELSSILTEMGMYEIKDELIRNLTEADEQFTNPILNKKIKYKGSDGKDKEGTVGNLLRLQKDHPGRKAAEAQLPPEDSEERKQINKDLGSQNQAKPTEPKAKDSKEEPTAGDTPKEEPKTNPMFEPESDPAMAARMDTEKQTLDKLAKADKQPEQSTELEPVSSDPNSKAKKFKGQSSGKEIQTIPMEGGGQIYGTVHRNKKMVDDIINHIKATIPEEKWKDIVFVGEGGSTNDSGELVFHDEMKYAAPKFKQLGAGIDTFDGDELDVHDDQSKLYKRQMEKTGFNQSQVKAGNWASMIGQGEGTDTMSPNDYLDNEGKKFLQDEAVNAGFPPIENWDEPTDKDIDTLYRLSFPEDYGDKETKINDIQVAFNEIRDESIIEKTKQLQSQGKIPITIAGESHVELVDTMMQKSEKPDSDFQPVEPNDVTKEMPNADSAAFSGQSDIDKLTKQERKEISMKIDELDKMTKDAIEKGEKAPNYNLCQVTVPGTNLYCDNNLGIPREDMPQFKGKPQSGTPAADMPVDKNGEVDTEPLFKQMLADRGIKVLDTEIPSDSLKATQSELVGSKVAGMTKALEKDPNHPAITAPIYVSRDGYVVDGHHRWAAVTSAAIKAGKPTDMKVRVIDMDAKDIIPMANKFAEEQGVAAKKADANQEGPKSDIANTPKVEDEKGTTAETPSGKKLYSVGGGYYSDRPDGEPKFIRTEVVARKAFLEGDEKAYLLIFEAEFSADVDGGEAGRFKEIPKKDRKDAAEDLKDKEVSTKTTKDTKLNSRQKAITQNLNNGDTSEIIKSSDETNDLRDEGIAGPGGAVASWGESTLTRGANEFKENGFSNFKQTNVDAIEVEKQNIFAKEKDYKNKINEVSKQLGLKLPEDKDKVIEYLAQRKLWGDLQLKRLEANPNSLWFKGGNTGLRENQKAFRDWADASFDGAHATLHSVRTNSNIDESKPFHVIQSNPAIGGHDVAIRTHLQDKLEEAKQSGNVDDVKHYEKEIKAFDKLGFHDTMVIGKDKNDRTTILHITNKKANELNDMWANTTPEYMLGSIIKQFGPEVSEAVVTFAKDGIERCKDGKQATNRAFASMKIDENFVKLSETEEMKPYMDTLRQHKEFNKFAKENGIDLEKASNAEVLAVTQKYIKLEEAKGKTVGYKVFGKVLTKIGEFAQVTKMKQKYPGIDFNSESVVSAVKNKNDEKDLVAAVHSDIVNEIGQADKERGFPDKDGNNGPHTEAYIATVIHSMHFDLMVENFDGSLAAVTGIRDSVPADFRGCLAELSGFKGDIESEEGRAQLNKHLLKQCKINATTGFIEITSPNGTVSLAEDSWRTSGESKKVEKKLGKGLRNCVAGKVDAKKAKK